VDPNAHKSLDERGIESRRLTRQLHSSGAIHWI
jgi:hypothetical protein